MVIHVVSYISSASSFINIYCDDEGMSFMTFVWRSLYPKGNNPSKDEGLLTITIYVALFLTHSIWEQVPNIGAHLRCTHFYNIQQSTDLRHAAEEDNSARGCCTTATGHKPGDSLSLREARSQKRKATNPTFQEEELDQEIRDMEIIHPQVQRKKEKMARLADLQRKIDEATEEVCQLTQDDQDRRPQHRELHQEGLFNEDGWYDDFNHDTFTFDDASPLAAELQAIPWPQFYKPPQLPMYDGHSNPKQFLMSYEATISSYGGNAAVMAKSFVMAVRNMAQTWYSSLRPGTITSWQKLKDMLVTSFQGFQTKQVIAQALFQCMQDHEEYLQAYVRRFLRLRAEALTVPNEIVIEAMIKGLRPRPMAQYFARKPPQTLEKLLQKMDEYIRADNDFRQRREEAYRFSEMTRGFGGRIHPRHVRSIHSSSQNDDKGSQLQRPQYTS
jgi:hypothetical protein